MRKKAMLAFKILSFTGIILIVLAMVNYLSIKKFIKNAIVTKAVVTNVLNRPGNGAGNGKDSSAWFPVVQFVNINGDTIVWHSNTGSNPPAFAIGDIVEVYYSLTSSRVFIKSLLFVWFTPILLSMMGFLFFLTGMMPILFIKIKQQKEKRIWENGEIVLAEFTQVKSRKFYSKTGAPFRIYAQWMNPVNQKRYIFKSDMLDNNPEQHVPGHIQVRIQPGHPQIYVMDTSFLPESKYHNTIITK